MKREKREMPDSANQPNKIIQKLSQPKTWLLIASLAVLIPLIFYAYLGIFSRHQADDYCYAWNATSRSLINSQIGFYRTDTSRFSATLVLSIGDIIGQRSISVFPSLIIVIWLLGSYLLFNLIQQLLNLELPPLAVFLLAETWIFFTLLLAPNLYQVLYWRPGLVIYLLPIAVLTWLVFLILSLVSNP
ncbi:hypothetical protein ACFLTX_03995, partial [Chloroflexota bacterium]